MVFKAVYRSIASPVLSRSVRYSSSMSGVVVDGFRTFQLAMIQLGRIQDDKKANLAHAAAMIRKAVQGSANGRPDLVMLPEIFNSPMQGPAHHPNAEIIPEVPQGIVLAKSELPDEKTSPTLHMLSSAAKECGIWLIGGSIPELPRDQKDSEKMSLNTLTVWDDQGHLVAKYSKIHMYDVNIPGGIVFVESESILPGSNPLIVKMPFGTIALAICFDIRFPNMISAMIEANPAICAYLLPSAFNMTTGPRDWEILQRVRAIDNQIFVGMCSPARDLSHEYVSYGHSLVCSPRGQVISSPTPEDEGEAIIYTTIDTELMKQARESLPLWRSQRNDVYTPPSLL